MTTQLQPQAPADTRSAGGFVSPERHVQSGPNDFGETLPRPMEFDLMYRGPTLGRARWQTGTDHRRWVDNVMRLASALR